MQKGVIRLISVRILTQYLVFLLKRNNNTSLSNTVIITTRPCHSDTASTQPHEQTTDACNMSSSMETPDGGPITPTLAGTAEVILTLFFPQPSMTNALEIVTSPVPTVADNDYRSSDDDGDSAFGATSNLTETATVDSSITRFREENGRTYHAYGLSTLIQGLPFGYL